MVTGGVPLLTACTRASTIIDIRRYAVPYGEMSENLSSGGSGGGGRGCGGSPLPDDVTGGKLVTDVRSPRGSPPLPSNSCPVHSNSLGGIHRGDSGGLPTSDDAIPTSSVCTCSISIDCDDGQDCPLDGLSSVRPTESVSFPKRTGDHPSPARCSSRVSLDSAAGDTGGLFGIDIGGSLAKLVLFVPQDRENRLKPVADQLAAFVSERSDTATTSFYYDQGLSLVLEGRGTFLFMSFESKDVEMVLDIVEESDLLTGMKTLSIAGGGAYRFESLLQQRLGVEVYKEDELVTVVQGVSFMLEHSPEELYAIEHTRFGEEEKMKRATRRQDEVFPYLLVNVGSGVSYIEVKGCYEFERVSGSALGGATYWGLCKLLTRYTSFDESMEAARNGVVTRVNLSVGDIYGGDYTDVGLPANITAAFFGKAIRSEDPRKDIEDADIAKALIQMIAQNVTHVAFLLAQARGIKRVIFTGNFLRHNLIAQQTVSYSLAKWYELATKPSSGDPTAQSPPMEALFLTHEGYFGAMGAFLANRTSVAGFHDLPTATSSALGLKTLQKRRERHPSTILSSLTSEAVTASCTTGTAEDHDGCTDSKSDCGGDGTLSVEAIDRTTSVESVEDSSGVPVDTTGSVLTDSPVISYDEAMHNNTSRQQGVLQELSLPPPSSITDTSKASTDTSTQVTNGVHGKPSVLSSGT